MAKVTFQMKKTTYGEIEVDLPDNYTEEDLEEARSYAYSSTKFTRICEWNGKMNVEMISEKVEQKLELEEDSFELD